MPKEFAQYATTRIIFDCTLYSRTFLNPSPVRDMVRLQASQKLLVGVDHWGRLVSDKQITRESRILDLLQAGDNVMVDRGFDISIIVPAGVRVNMPPFLAGCDQMAAAETEETMNIASVRIHVKHAVGPIKVTVYLQG